MLKEEIICHKLEYPTQRTKPITFNINTKASFYKDLVSFFNFNKYNWISNNFFLQHIEFEHCGNKMQI